MRSDRFGRRVADAGFARLEVAMNWDDFRLVRAIAEAGPDFISVGRLTHSAPAIDLGLDVRARTASPRARRAGTR